MTTVDYFVIGVYLAFMLALGPVYKRFSKTASDYFRGGGGMLWWMVGASAWVMTFTAWTFTGGAGKVYETGTFFLLLITGNIIATVIMYFFTAARYRQMRVITPIEAARDRFGRTSEQWFTWLPVPINILRGGVSLYAIAIFMAVVFGIDIWKIIVSLGVIVTLMCIFGGSWAVIASDFVQMLTILVITLVVSFLTLHHPKVGGMSGLLDKVPDQHFDWTIFDRPSVLLIFMLTLFLNQTVQMNSLMEGAGRFIYVKTGKDAKRALWISFLGTIIFTPVFILPAMAASFVHPELEVAKQLKAPIALIEADMSAAGEAVKVTSLDQLATLAESRDDSEQLMPLIGEAKALGIDSLDDQRLAMELNNPREASYVMMAMDVLPAGMLGLLVCGIFAATMSSMDVGLNRAAGIFVRNFWIVFVKPEASESHQVRVGQITTLIFGILQILAGLAFISYADLPLFELILVLAAVFGLPMAIPLFFGIFIKRTPPWAGWSSMVLGIVTGLLMQPATIGGWQWKGLVNGDLIQRMFSVTPAFNGTETNDLRVALTTFVVFAVTFGWFMLSIPFAAKSSEKYKAQVDAFFERMDTPIDPVAEGVTGWSEDRKHYHIMGVLCMLYGGFIVALMFLPNPMWGRLCFLFCGGVIAALGLVLYGISRRKVELVITADGTESATPVEAGK